MRPNRTFELHISFVGDSPEQLKIKDSVIAWLSEAGCDSFVEGVVEGLDLPFEYVDPDRDYYGEMGGGLSNITIYKFDREYLEDLQARAEHRFGGQIQCRMDSMETKIWEEGWKESFLPFSTRRLRVCPPWVQEQTPAGLRPLVIEPGMAFGSGQHATTQICLRLIEDVLDLWSDAEKTALKAADVGTGSGILSIAMIKLGVTDVVATDIDVDALQSSKGNAGLNQVAFPVSKGSVPLHLGPFQIVVANILTVVLRELVPQMPACLAPGGRIILSGILAEEVDEMVSIAAAVGLREDRRVIADGWAGLVLAHAT